MSSLKEYLINILSEDTKDISSTIFSQLGGQGKLKAMLGAKDFAYDSKNGDVMFKFTAKADKGINYIKVHLNGNDLYDIEFKKVRNLNADVITKEEDIYAEDLKKTIENVLKLRLSL